MLMASNCVQRVIPAHYRRASSPGWGGGGVLGLIFGGYVQLASQSPIIYPIIYPILVPFGQICNFRDPKWVTFYFYGLTHFRLNEEHFAFHL